MAIDINSLTGNLTGNRVRTAGQPAGRDEVSKPESRQLPDRKTAVSEGVSVSLSEEALRLSSSSKATPDIDQDKVSAVRAAIENGSYKIDYAALAKDIIGFEGQF